MNPLTPLKFIVAVVIVVSLGGCLSQPTDAVTGKAFGPALHAGQVAPTTSPAGNGVVVKSTGKADVGAIISAVDQTQRSVLPAIPGWGVVVSSLLSLLAGVAVRHYWPTPDDTEEPKK